MENIEQELTFTFNNNFTQEFSLESAAEYTISHGKNETIFYVLSQGIDTVTNALATQDQEHTQHYAALRALMQGGAWPVAYGLPLDQGYINSTAYAIAIPFIEEALPNIASQQFVKDFIFFPQDCTMKKTALKATIKLGCGTASNNMHLTGLTRALSSGLCYGFNKYIVETLFSDITALGY